MNEKCFFCEEVIPNPERWVMENGVVLAFRDGFPVTKHHTLILPFTHKNNYFDLNRIERRATDDLIVLVTKEIIDLDETVTGFNIGWNCGHSAGQTIGHAHCHIIPRRDGDIDNPIGGVRGVIPEKRIY